MKPTSTPLETDRLRTHGVEGTRSRIDHASLPHDVEHDEHSPHVFAVSAGLLGAALSGIGPCSVVTSVRSIVTLGEEMLAANSAFFAVSCSPSFLSMKATRARRNRMFRRVADSIFLLGLLMMAGICIYMAFAIG